MTTARRTGHAPPILNLLQSGSVLHDQEAEWRNWRAVLMAMIRCVPRVLRSRARGLSGQPAPGEAATNDAYRSPVSSAHKEAELKEEAARRARELEERREMILGRADGEK